MVVDLAGLARDPVLLAAHAVGTFRQPVENPVGDVDVMDVLLADVVTAEPIEVIPVVDLKLGLRHLGIAALIPDAGTIPIHLATDDVAGEPLADFRHGLAIPVVIAPLQADDHLEFLLVGHLRRLETEPGTEGIDADRLLHEDVLAGLDRRIEMERAKARRRGQNHQIAMLEHLLVAVETLELPVLRTVDLLLHRLDRLEGTLDAVVEGIGHGCEFHVRPRHGERLLKGAGAPAAGADEADPNHLARRRLPLGTGLGGHRASDDAGSLEGIAAGKRGSGRDRSRIHAHGSRDRACGYKLASRIPCPRHG